MKTIAPKRVMSRSALRAALLLGCCTLYLLEAGERVGWLGVSVEPVPEAVRHQVELPRGAGLTVREVAPESPAAEAGLRRFDILLRLEDQWLYEPGQLSRLVQSYQPGSELQVLYLRRGTRHEVNVTLAERPPEAGPQRPEIRWPGGGPWPMPFGSDWRDWMDWFSPRRPSKPGFGWARQAFLGVVVADPGPEVLEPLDRSEEEGGALVQEVLPESPAQKAGICENDLIIALDGKPFRDSRSLVLALQRRNPGDTVELTLLREGRQTKVKAKLSRRPSGVAFPGTPPPLMKLPQIEWGPGGGSVDERREPDRPEQKSPSREANARAKVEVHVKGTPLESSETRQAVVTMVDEAGRVILTEVNGRRHVYIQDAEGRTVFEGDVAADEEPELPEAWQERYRKAVRLLNNPPSVPEKRSIRKLRLPGPPPTPGFIREPRPADLGEESRPPERV